VHGLYRFPLAQPGESSGDVAGIVHPECRTTNHTPGGWRGCVERWSIGDRRARRYNLFLHGKDNKRMHPKEQLQADLKTAMKSGDTQRKDALRFILAAIQQVEVDTRSQLTEDQTYGVLATEAKKRRDSIDEARKAGRNELADKEQMELGLIQSYLPQQLSREELEAEARKAIDETGAKTPKDMGNVMKVLMPRVKGRADGKLVNEVVKSLLNG
jgi:uncharacterized protein YqeY